MATPAGLRGLTQAEAARLRAEHGPNALAEPPRRPAWRRVLRQLASPLIYILLFAVAFDLGTWIYEGARGWPLEAIVIGAVLALNAGLGTIQEYRSEQAIARLRSLAAPQAWALRDGALVQIPAAELVPGDVIRIEAGDRIPADGELADADGLAVDESVLTGESVPVDKERGDEALSGTLAVRGRAFVAVQRTGPASNMGKLASMLGGIEMGQTPLERRLDELGARIARWVGALAAVLVVGGVVSEGAGQLDEVILFAVALAVAAVPEGMPAVVTLTLAFGVQRMARRRAVVRRLSAVEALGSVTVIATDKTGTLTENRMTVKGVEGPSPDEARRAMVLASDAELDVGVGDPLELALLADARDHGIDPAALRREHARIGGRPFDSAWRYQSVVVEGPGGRASYWKGAVEALLPRCGLDDAERARWARLAEARAAAGYRILALARGGDGADGADDADRGPGTAPLTFLGLALLWDPPRPEVPGAIAKAQAAGLRIVMITGDHPATAQAVARAVGIAGADRPPLTGADLDGRSRDELRAMLRRTSVLARVSPEHKLAVVDALRADGEIVAVTGDGVNDAPALKRADVGVAMGQRGSDVAREVADLVLLDDNFASIVAAVEEGRGIFANIQKFIRFLFSTNVALVTLVVGGAIGSAIFDLRTPDGALLLPLTAIQLLWINFLADGPPALALGVDQNPGVMDRPPRAPDQGLLDRPSLRFILLTGVAKAGVGLGLLAALPALGRTLSETRTAVFLYESIAQLVFAYPSRRVGGTPLHNLWLHAAIVLGIVVQILTVVLPGLRRILDLVPIDVATAGVIAACVAGTWLLAELINSWLRRAAPASVTPAASRPAPARTDRHRPRAGRSPEPG